MTLPWMKFAPKDWRNDVELRTCSLAARGLWIDLVCIMHEAEPYGHLLINGKPAVPRQLAAIVGASLSECMKLMLELANAGVYSIDEKGRIYSRRMVRDKAKADQDRENGKGGGNPKLVKEDNGGVNPLTNPPDKAKKIEERKDAADAPPDLEKELFRRGKEVLGGQAGGLISKLLTAKQKNIALARAAIEHASTKENPREYIGAVLRKPAGEPNWLGGIEGII